METYKQTIFSDMHTCISLADDIDFTFDSHLIIFGYVSIQLNHFKEEQVHKLEPCIEMCIFPFSSTNMKGQQLITITIIGIIINCIIHVCRLLIYIVKYNWRDLFAREFNLLLYI